MNNLSVLNVTLFGVGAVLIYAAVKDIDPRDVVRVALGQKPTHTKDGTFINGIFIHSGAGAVGSAAVTHPAPGDRTKN